MKENAPATPVKEKKKVYKTPTFRAYASVKNLTTSQPSNIREQMMNMMPSGGGMM